MFRFQPEGVDPAVADEANIKAREELWREGRAIVGRTRIGDRVFLKFTLLNPRTTLAGVRDVLRELRTRIEMRSIITHQFALERPASSQSQPNKRHG